METFYKKFFSTLLLSYYLRVYGYKAFVLIMAVLKKLNKLKRLLLKIWIGYLIGYLLINLYCIRIPLYNKVIIIRDVYFNEKEMFNGNIEIFKCDVKNIFLEYLAEVVRNAIRRVIIIVLLTTYNNTVEDLKWFYKSEGNEEKIRLLEDLVPMWRNEYIIAVFELLPISLNTPLKCLFTAVLIAAMFKDISSRSLLSLWEYKFELV